MKKLFTLPALALDDIFDELAYKLLGYSSFTTNRTDIHGVSDYFFGFSMFIDFLFYK